MWENEEASSIRVIFHIYAFHEQGVGREAGRAAKLGKPVSFGEAEAARVERSGLWLESGNLWGRMGGKEGSDFSLTGGKGPDWYLGIYEDSLKAKRT